MSLTSASRTLRPSHLSHIGVAQALAYRLATCRLCLRRLRRRLVAARGRAPLFDAASWLRAWQRALAALADAAPHVPARPPAGPYGYEARAPPEPAGSPAPATQTDLSESRAAGAERPRREATRRPWSIVLADVE
jgi:hypothetical protein